MTSVALTYMNGALSLGCAVIAIFFLRYYRLSRDELFLWFAGAFVALGAQWTLLAFSRGSEHAHLSYLVRFAAFLMIVIGILRKNRSLRPR
ncbi:MAG: hypothetical protein JNL83_02865 [Myxococcales bacterium]|nr:hypothetical protein [Myxococcales bacterium]